MFTRTHTCDKTIFDAKFFHHTMINLRMKDMKKAKFITQKGFLHVFRDKHVTVQCTSKQKFVQMLIRML